MLSFNKFITEARMTTRGEIVNAIAQYKKAGEIINPAYQDLSSQTKRVLEGDTKHVVDLMLKHLHAGDRTPDLNDLYYSFPRDNFVSMAKAERILAKIKDPKYKDVVSAGTEVLKNWKPVAADLKDLKGKVVKVTQKRAEAKTAAAAVMQSKMNDSSSLIKVLESHLQEYKDMAEKRANEFVDARLDALKKADWDLNKVAPRPKSDDANYTNLMIRHSLYTAITNSKSAIQRRNDPDIRVPNQGAIKRYISDAVKGAEASYRDFMHKMITKIGKPVIDAKMTGSIWINAVLTVTTNDGESQVWNTKMILNFSKYQKMFNQFPSRKVK